MSLLGQCLCVHASAGRRWLIVLTLESFIIRIELVQVGRFEARLG